MKSHDVFHGAGCRACHYEIDNGKLLSKDDRRHYMQAARDSTLLIYFKKGWLKVDV